MGGIGDRIKGIANEATGKLTGDRTKQTKGKGQQGKGRAKNKAQDVQRGRKAERRQR